MALTVSILRQPLYGSVSWNGYSFIYTPNNGFSGSDSFVYSEYVNGVERVYTKYVNTSNTPPVALATALSANPYISTEIDINSVVIDYNNPFNYLQFIDVSSSLNSTIYTDGNVIYYTPDTASALDIITYRATDKQFTITGRISVNVLSASEGAPYNYSPLEKLYQFKDITSSYERNSSGWTGSYNVYVQYGATWDTIDLNKYEGFADNVIAGYSPWNSVYDYRNIYYSVYTNLTSHSGRWMGDIPSGNYYFGIINPKALLWNDVYSILNSGSGQWNATITNFNKLSSSLDYTQPLYVSSSNTVNSVSNIKWSYSELDNWSYAYLNLFRNAFTYTSANSSRWIAPVSGYQSLSSGMTNVVDNVKSTSTTVYTNSSNWDNSDLNYLSAAYYDKWTLAYSELSSNQNKFNAFSTAVDSVSEGLVIVNNNSDLLLTTISANSADRWNNYQNETFISNNSANWFAVYNQLTALSSAWYTENPIVSIINSNSNTFDNTANTVSSNSAIKWSSLDSNQNLILATSSSLILLYNSLTSLSVIWAAPGNIASTIGSVSGDFNSYYDTVLTNLSSLWDNSNTTLLSAKSGYWTNLYNTLVSISTTWGASSDLPNAIGSVSGDFNSYYDTVLTNLSSSWDDSNNTLLSAKSGFWKNNYNVISANSGAWTSGNTLSATITEGRNKFDSTFSTITANSANNWIGMTVYNSISDNVAQFQILRELFYVKNIDSIWSDIQPIYTKIFDSYNYYYPYFNSTSTTVENGSSYWDTTYVNQILSGLSANLISNYNFLTASTGYWKFTEDQNLKNTYSYVSSNSAKLNNEYTVLTSSLTSWNNGLNISTISGVSSQYLSGSSTANVSSRNLNIYGNLVVGLNLSALGSKTSISTSNYSLTGFEVTNDSNTDCFIITKSSNLNNVATFSSADFGPVLSIRADNKVGINTTTPNQALTILGSISASGAISNYLGSQITILQVNSAKYEAGYTFATTNSGFITSFNSSKLYYDDMTNYYNNSSTKINTVINNDPLYSSISNNISSNYNINSNVNNFVTYSTANINIDTVYRTVTGKYDNTYNTLTSVCANQLISLTYLFSFNKVVSSDKAKLIIPYNLKISSWSVFSDQPTTLSIEVLSGYTFNKSTYTNSITNNNPITASNASKATANQLDTLGWTTVINAGGTNPSFIQFNLTKNDSSSAVMVNLKAYKI